MCFDYYSGIVDYDLVVVGAGLFGLTIAELAANSRRRVLVLEKRKHIGGNAFSEIDQDTGIEVHKYGSHLFHTSNPVVWEYVSKFTSFNSYKHKVYARHKDQIFPFPINLATINQFFEKAMSPSEAREFIDKQKSKKEENDVLSFEDKAIGVIGRDLYDAFIQGYTLKQWNTNPKDLSPEIFTRLPVRYNYEHRYFSDTWEGLPTSGYSSWFQNMIDHPRIELILNHDFLSSSNSLSKYDLVGSVPIVYTGPIDGFFSYSEGELGWRTLDFEFEKLPLTDYQGTSVMNFCDIEFPFTRIHEFKHLHPERKDVWQSENTIIAKEYSRFATNSDEAYYPIATNENNKRLLKYRERADEIKSSKVFFGGRLGTYKYLDMHMAIASAITLWNNVLKEYTKSKLL